MIDFDLFLISYRYTLASGIIVCRNLSIGGTITADEEEVKGAAIFDRDGPKVNIIDLKL